ncbi:hypothetical protein [Halobacillus salinus]|uniref:hypothetical protein n=1 Tax=Halobacillus salinus TaxID=192814 RepID=UPI0009A56B6E|nr:hypothetical protein [Halobacillus salinus]
MIVRKMLRNIKKEKLEQEFDRKLLNILEKTESNTRGLKTAIALIQNTTYERADVVRVYKEMVDIAVALDGEDAYERYKNVSCSIKSLDIDEDSKEILMNQARFVWKDVDQGLQVNSK